MKLHCYGNKRCPQAEYKGGLLSRTQKGSLQIVSRKTFALTRSYAVKLKTLNYLPMSQRKHNFLRKQQIEGNSSKPSQSPLMSDLAPENQEETKEENHYLSPRSILAQLNDIIASSEDKEFAESKESDQVSKPTDHLYMSMKSCFDEEKFQQSFNSKEEALPANQDEGLNLQRQEERNKSCHSSSSKEPKTENQKRRLSSLSIVQLSRIINNIPAGSSLEEVDVFLSKNDINKYLTFTQAIGHICVAQWEGPPHLGCIFHQGDRLSAVNDLKPHNLEEVGLFLDRSLKKEVKLTICRIPDSDKFHTVTCACS
ncbi:pleckstrin homology domain-containing family S member 1-like [Sarcophilus harrisii]